VIDPKILRRLREAHTHRLGFADLDALEEAEMAGNLASDCDY